MPASRPCHPPKRVRPAALPLRGPDDALGVVLATLSDPPRPQVVVLLLDAEHRGLAVVVVDGASDLDTLGDTVEFVARSADTVDALRAVVLATIRPGGTHVPDHGEACAFFELRAELDDVGIGLVDWFVICGGVATSVAELTDARSLWCPS